MTKRKSTLPRKSKRCSVGCVSMSREEFQELITQARIDGITQGIIVPPQVQIPVTFTPRCAQQWANYAHQALALNDVLEVARRMAVGVDAAWRALQACEDTLV